MARDLFTVLAEPARRDLLDALREGERAVGELVDALGLAQPTVSKHLRVLADAGLVRARADGNRRIYSVDAAPLRDVDRWLAPYRTTWALRLDALERHLDAEGSGPAPTTDHPREDP